MERLPEDTVAAILLRLPSKSVLRAGAACKAWRRITTAPHFVAARAPPPASIIVCTDLDGSPWPHLALDAVPVSSSDSEDGAAGRRRLVRYPNTPLHIKPHCLLLASCEGVLLFATGAGCYLLCNPVTRRWAEMPRLAGEYSKEIDFEYAFYHHRPSGDFRLLCCSLRRRAWFVVSTGAGAAEPRILKANAANDPGLITQFIDSLFMVTAVPVALHGNLHWPPRWTTIMVFDMVSETFSQMPGPPSGTPNRVKLFEMGGLLAAADFGEKELVDLWLLEDYAAGLWVRRHRVASPWDHGKGRPRNHSGMQSVAAAGDGKGNVILGNNKGLAVYDVRETAAVRSVVDLVLRRELVSKHVFKGSMVEHACFATPPSADLPFIHSWS
ncbi:unnamed protein product [Urochloa decumbens]|uniref:F-box domain-containing protein n=1 Tax=Urochloa decumbens TaxID=240449 RepID=A0ABC9AWD3_9POAL